MRDFERRTNAQELERRLAVTITQVIAEMRAEGVPLPENLGMTPKYMAKAAMQVLHAFRNGKTYGDVR